WARSPYRLQGKDTGRPRYIEDLTPLNGHQYVLPAWPLGNCPSFRFERFNALSDSYWYAMTNNRVATAREDLPLKRTGKKPNTYRPSNFPQTGRLRMLERGNRLQTLVFGEVELPEYIRVGKFMSKVRLEVGTPLPVQVLPTDTYCCNTYLNSADLPRSLDLLRFDVMSIPPAPLLKHLQFRGPAWQVGDWICPANLDFCGGNSDETP
ncbi:MAG: type I-D CRISPR-associated protein Cas5/Csc1, partial [Phormidium sp.]